MATYLLRYVPFIGRDLKMENILLDKKKRYIKIVGKKYLVVVNSVKGSIDQIRLH